VDTNTPLHDYKKLSRCKVSLRCRGTEKELRGCIDFDHTNVSLMTLNAELTKYVVAFILSFDSPGLPSRGIAMGPCTTNPSLHTVNLRLGAHPVLCQ